MKNLGSMSLMIASSSLLISNLHGVDVSVAQQALIDTIVKKQNSSQTVKTKKIDGKKVIIKAAKSRVMVQLKAGINPKIAYTKLHKQSKNDIEFIKSFPIVDSKASINKASSKKHIMVLQSKSMSNKELLDIAKKISGAELAEESKVISINSVSQNFPNDPGMSELWGMHNSGDFGLEDADIDAPEAWVKHRGNPSVVVGVIDTGIDYTHPDLQDNVWVNYAELNGAAGVDDDGNGWVDDIHGIDTVNYDSDPMDDNGHGTHVSGTIGATGNNSLGVVGVNWRVKIAACKFLDYDGYGWDDGAIECVNYFNGLKAAGTNIVATNNSWSGGGYSEFMENVIIEADAQNINFVAAAGNDYGNDNDANPIFPANYMVPNVISVAATNSNDELASFSNFGATTVHLAAPGEDILSTLPSNHTCQQNGNTIYYSENFEAGDNNWSMLTVNPEMPIQDYPNEHWTIDNTMAYSGSKSLSDNLDGNYTSNRLQTAMMKESLDLSAVAENDVVCASLKIKGNVEEGYDSLNILASPDGGENWYILGVVHGEVSDWTEFGAYIPTELRTNNLKFAIVRYSDCCFEFRGYNIDDVTVGSGDLISISNYGYLSGTSMATPHVTGAIAYFANIEDSETAANRVSRILNSVDVLPSLNGMVLTNGRLNIDNALNTPEYDANLARVIGEWDFNYNWTLNIMRVTLASDFTFTTNESENGTWAYNGSSFMLTYTNGTTYSSTVTNLAAGHMSGTMFNGGHDDNIPDGTWSASKVDVTTAAKNDFNGDAISDIYWRDGINNYVWLMNTDGTYSEIDLGTKGSAWVVEGLADFNADGITDILWRNAQSNQIWYMNDDGTHTGVDIANKDAAWSVEGLGDFTGDGIADILWRSGVNNHVWQMNANGTHTEENIGARGTAWSIQEVGDLDGDGVADILWKRNANNHIWYMNTDSTHTNIDIGQKGKTWATNGIGDFNGDGTADILWRDTSFNHIWNMNQDGSYFQTVIAGKGVAFTITQIADYNGDGVTDILWNGNGTNQIWYMGTDGSNTQVDIGSF